MSLSDLLHEWRHQRRLTVMGWNRRVEPEEEAFCEDCGASISCECNTALNYESEKEETNE